MIKIFSARNPAEAHLVKGLLCSRGVHAEVRGESLFTVEGATAIPGMLPAVWVPEEEDQLRRTRDALSQFQGSPQEKSEAPWTCPGCGEISEAQFTDCWKCGLPQTAAGA